MFTMLMHKLFTFYVPQLAALPALERQPVNLAAFMQTDAGELLFAMRTSDMRNIRFHSRRYTQHLLVHLLLSMITQIKRRLVAIYFSKRGTKRNQTVEKRLYESVQPQSLFYRPRLQERLIHIVELFARVHDVFGGYCI